MSVTDPRLNNAASPLYLRDEQGRDIEILVTRLTDVDISELDEWVQSRFVKLARASLGDDATQKERDETLRLAMHEAAGLTWMSGQGAKMMASVDGMARLVWQAARSRQPEIAFERIRALMFNPANVQEAARKLNEMRATMHAQRGEHHAGKAQSAAEDKRADRRRRAKKSTARSRRPTAGRSTKSPA